MWSFSLRAFSYLVGGQGGTGQGQRVWGQGGEGGADRLRDRAGRERQSVCGQAGMGGAGRGLCLLGAASRHVRQVLQPRPWQCSLKERKKAPGKISSLLQVALALPGGVGGQEYVPGRGGILQF